MTPLTIATLFASFVAVLAAIIASRAAKSGSVASLSRRLNTLQELFDSHSDRIGTMDETIRLLRARIGMRELREKRREAPTIPPSIESDDEKARARADLSRKLANGEIKPLGR